MMPTDPYRQRVAPFDCPRCGAQAITDGVYAACTDEDACTWFDLVAAMQDATDG